MEWKSLGVDDSSDYCCFWSMWPNLHRFQEGILHWETCQRQVMCSETKQVQWKLHKLRSEATAMEEVESPDKSEHTVTLAAITGYHIFLYTYWSWGRGRGGGHPPPALTSAFLLVCCTAEIGVVDNWGWQPPLMGFIWPPPFSPIPNISWTKRIYIMYNNTVGYTSCWGVTLCS